MQVLRGVLSCWALGCGLVPSVPDAAVPPSDGGATGCPLEAALITPDAMALQGIELGRRTVTVLGVTRELVLLRLPTADGKSTFAVWAPPLPGAGVQPAVLPTQPYDGIDWSGEAVDARWASACATGACLRSDTDGPGGGPAAGVIGYALLSPETWAQQAGVTVAPEAAQQYLLTMGLPP